MWSIFSPLCSRIKHFAGTVKYDARDFVIRNLDSLDKDLSMAMYACNHPLLKVLFPEGKTNFGVLPEHFTYTSSISIIIVVSLGTLKT